MKLIEKKISLWYWLLIIIAFMSLCVGAQVGENWKEHLYHFIFSFSILLFILCSLRIMIYFVCVLPIKLYKPKYNGPIGQTGQYTLADNGAANEIKYTLAEIDLMEGYEFERCMKQVFESLGFLVYHTPLSGDQGADLVLTSKRGVKTAVQIKRYSGKVSNGAVQEVVAAKGFHKCTESMVVTNSYFTDSARQLARANDVSLVDRQGLIKLLNEALYVTNETVEE